MEWPKLHLGGEDRVSIKVQPRNDFHLILHRGSKVLPEPNKRILDGQCGLSHLEIKRQGGYFI